MRRFKRPEPKEAELTRAVRDMLKSLKIFHFKHWAGPMTSPKGISDILGCYKGRMIAIELKKPGWKPPKPTSKAYKHYRHQADFIDAVRRAGGVAFFAQSIDDVIDGLGVRDRFLF